MSEFARRIYRLIFAAAAAYNIAFGLWAALFPFAFFNIFQMLPPRYPGIWACLGMVVGLYGVGYAYAAWRLDRAFPFIAIGLAGKVLGPIGWFLAVGKGELPFRTFPLIVFDDLMWWIPFGMFLLEGTAVVTFLKRTAPNWCGALHAIAGVGTLVLLRGGSEAVPDVQQRIAYLNAHPDRWRVGWLLWMIAALSLAGFYAWWGSAPHAALRATLSPQSGERDSRTASSGVRGPALTAFAVAALGLVCDFAGESLFIGWIPAPNTAMHRAASLLSGAAGNGLYTLAGIVLTVASPLLPPLLRGWAWLAWASGIALTIFTVLNIPSGIVISSGALMVLFTPWVVAMGAKLR